MTGRQRLLDLILYKTYAELKFEAQRTYVGFLWWLIEPIIFMLVFYFVFSVVLGRGTSDFVPFLLIGLTAFHWHQSTVLQASTSIISNLPLIQQVYVPKLVFPTVVMLSTSVKFLAVFFVLLLYLTYYGIEPSWAWLYSIIVLGNIGLLTASLSYLASAVTPFLPDLRILLDNGFRVLFFVSGIFFDISTLPQSLADVFRLNPMVFMLDDLRGALLHHQAPGWGDHALMALSSIALGTLGLYIMRLNELRYAKVSF